MNAKTAKLLRLHSTVNFDGRSYRRMKHWWNRTPRSQRNFYRNQIQKLIQIK